MPDNAPKAERPTQARGAALLTAGGIAAAFGVASCCALPILLTTAGLSAAWLGGVAVLAFPYRTLLLCLSALCLVGGAVLLWRIQRRAMICGPDGVCTPPSLRAGLFVGLVVGAVLLYLGYSYV